MHGTTMLPKMADATRRDFTLSRTACRRERRGDRQQDGPRARAGAARAAAASGVPRLASRELLLALAEAAGPPGQARGDGGGLSLSSSAASRFHARMSTSLLT